MNNIFILDGQNDNVIGHINKKYVIDNEHEKDLPTHKDYFRFTVLAENKYAEHLNKRNGLIVPGEDGELLEFRIFESIKYRNDEGLFIEVHALATYLDLKNQKIFDPHKTNPETALQHANLALAGTEWQVGQVDYKGVRTLEFDNPFNSYDYILRIAREFELEPRFYIETDGNKITGRYVDLIERIGEFRGRTIEFGRDLQSIERKEDTSEVVTALWVYGPQREDGTRLKVFIEDDEARQRWGRRGQHIIDYYEPQTENQDITEERLKTLGEMELKKRINAVVTYEAEILDLENVPGLENKKIRFGDTIRIKDTKFNPPLYLEARVFNVKRDVFNKANKTVQLGDYREYTEEEIKELFRQMQEEIRRRLERLVLVSIISSAGNVFKNGVGSTELTAKTFLSGNEVDEDGTKYEYRWHKFDKNGDYVPGFYEEGKTITVNASDIDEKATFRVEIILDDELLTVHEITLTNVFDGEDGEPGPPGPKGDKGDKGEDGQSVEDITIEYYLSTSDSTQTGGTWTETKPTYQPGKYLWIRQKITYKNPTAIEYTTPVLDDSWKAVEIADEAKQEAEEAKQTAQQAQTTADGKNTVFRQSSTPPTTNRKIGDLWFKTNEGNKMFVWTGSAWTETKLDHQALSVGKLSAISADLGNITAGHIQGVTVEGSHIISGDQDGSRIELSTDSQGTPYLSSYKDGEERVLLTEDFLAFFYNNELAGAIITGYEDEPFFPGESPMGQHIQLQSPGLVSFASQGYLRFAVHGSGSWAEHFHSNTIGWGYFRSIPLWVSSLQGQDLVFSTSGYGNFIVDRGIHSYDNITAGTSSGNINLRPGNEHGYIEFHRSSGRAAYVGINSANSAHFDIDAHGLSGNIRLRSSNVFIEQRLISPRTYEVTAQSPANVLVTSSGYLARSTSSKRYKADIQYNDIDYKKILKLQQASWVDRKEFENNDMSAEGLKRYYGAIAEDFEKIGLSEFVVYNEETGEVENFSDRAWVLLIPNINDILNELKQIKERLERLENEGNSV